MLTELNFFFFFFASWAVSESTNKMIKKVVVRKKENAGLCWKTTLAAVIVLNYGHKLVLGFVLYKI